MGLDISLEKIIVPTEELIIGISEGRDFGYDMISIIDHIELRIFKDYSFRFKKTMWDFEGTFNQKGLIFQDYRCTSVENIDGRGSYFHYERIINNTMFSIRSEDILEISIIDECILTKNIGYQRKGENSQFHKDNMCDHPLVADYETLVRHWHQYFSKTESDMQNFKENIVARFIQGETYVWYC